jgi:hypothetical protein
MNKEEGPGSKIDRILVGDPVVAGGRTFRPVARVGGWLGGGHGEQGWGLGGWLRVRPLEVRVSDPGGEEYTVSISDPTGDAVRRIALAGLFVAAVSVLVLVVGLLRPRM